MKIKTTLWAVCLLVSFFSFTAQAINFWDSGGSGGPGVGPKMIQIPPVVLEIESGNLHITFTRDLGLVNLQVQDAAGATVATREVEAYASQKETVSLPAGTYTLTVTNATVGSLIIETAVEIP